jgi:hypothetical protein
MGYEAKCHVRVDDGRSVREADDATVLLETDELVVRGDARIRIPRTAIQRVAVRGGIVTVTSPTATVALTLDDNAAKWEKKLLEPPKRVIDKLDVKPDAKVWLLQLDEPTLVAQLEDRTANLSRGTSATRCDVVFVGVEREQDLARIDRAAKAIVDDGAIWVVHRKGPTGIADTTIFARAKLLGLTYTKVARISDVYTAEKLVRPVAARGTSAASRARTRAR